jgi:thioredoxin 1
MTEPTREDVDRMSGPVLLEFGAGWCPHCPAIQPFLDAMLARTPDVQHIPVEDGRGKPLGRPFRVKLWPTLVFMRDGRLVSRLVRPSSEEIAKAIAELGTKGTLESPTA